MFLFSLMEIKGLSAAGSVAFLLFVGLTLAASAQQTSNSSATNSTVVGTTSGNATGASQSPGGNSTTVNVSIVPNAQNLGARAYSPNPANVTVGQTVVWTNDDTILHTVTSGNGSGDPKMGKEFDSGLTGSNVLKTKGSTFSHTFTTPGTYPYFCEVHPTMVGKVIVTSATSAVPEFPTAGVALGATIAVIAVVIAISRLRTGTPL